MTSPDPAPRYEPEPASAAKDTAIDPLADHHSTTKLPAPYIGPPSQTYMGPPAETYYQAPPPYQGPPPASYPGPTGYPAFTHAPPPPYPYYSPTPFVHSRPTNGLAIAAMVTSIIGLVTLTFCLPIGVVGAIMGHIARGQIRRSNEDGEGFALAGVIIGWLGLALFVLAILLFAAPFLLLLGLIGASG